MRAARSHGWTNQKIRDAWSEGNSPRNWRPWLDALAELILRRLHEGDCGTTDATQSLCFSAGGARNELLHALANFGAGFARQKVAGELCSSFRGFEPGKWNQRLIGHRE